MFWVCRLDGVEGPRLRAVAVLGLVSGARLKSSGFLPAPVLLWLSDSSSIASTVLRVAGRRLHGAGWSSGSSSGHRWHVKAKCSAFRELKQANRSLKRSCTTLAHSRRSCACKERAISSTMMLSRARPLALRTLRQQRALSAAPQPVYEPHVVLHQRPDQTPTADAEKNKSGKASAAGYFKTTRHAIDATPE